MRELRINADDRVMNRLRKAVESSAVQRTTGIG
ncbi:MAG: hypothetical protein BWY99_00313 [Synergistetes bacterium ADurb.BinA166]|nr:MAG: hypothetical protein BWY99_00313 [Synergistetes bacterium ADurb.BinA166]